MDNLPYANEHTYKEWGRLALALGPYIILAVIMAWGSGRADMALLPFMPVALGLGLPRALGAYRIAIWMAGCLLLAIGCYMVFGDLAAGVVLAATLIRGFLAVR